MAKLFLSYTIYDRELVDRLESVLTSQGHTVFVDRGQVATSSSWAETIRDAIENADVFVVIVSRPALRDDYAVGRAEVGAAWARGKPIVAIEAQGVSAEASLRLPRGDFHVVSVDGLSDDQIAAAIVARAAEPATSSAR